MSMAPNDEVSGLRTALAMGAAKGILVSDPSLQGSDALTTAKVLAAAISRLGGADLDHRRHRVERRLHRHRARADGRDARPAVGHVRQARRRRRRTLKVNRQTEEGYDEVTCPLPAVISVTAGVVEPRYPSFKGIMAAKSKPVETVTAADLGVTPGRLGRRRPDDRQRHQGRGPQGRRDHRRRRRGIRQDRGVPREPEGHLRSIMNIWVFAQESNGAPTTGTLELLTKARSLGDRHGVRRRRRVGHRRLRSASTAPPRSTPPAISAASCRASPCRRR